MSKVKQIEMKEIKEDKINLDDIKDELKNYIDKEIKSEYQNEITKINNKLVREKNKKIIFRNIIILILIIIIGFLIYLLYDNNYFSKILVKDNDIKEEVKTNTNNKEKEEIKEEDKEKKEEVKKTTLSELKEKYGKLIDNYYISDLSNYKEDYYNGNLTNELKSYMTLNKINFNDLEIDDNSNIISEEEFSEVYESLFNDQFVGTNFDYNNNKVRYLSKVSSFITEKVLIKDKNNIVREIINIEENGSIIKITCVEGKVINNILYNINSDEEIGSYNGDITNYKDKLNNVTYIFENSKLINLSK